MNTGVGSPIPSPGELPNPGIEMGSPALQADSFLSQPPGKPMNTGVGSLSPGDLPNPGIYPGSPALQVDSLLSEPPGKLRLVIAFLPKGKRLLISWLQTQVILQPPKIKSVTVSIVSPSICHEVMGPNAMVLVF